MQYRNRQNTMMSLFGMIIGLLGASLTFTIRVFPKIVVDIQLILLAGGFLALMAMMIIGMLRSSVLLMKVAAIPVTFGVVMTSLFVYHSGVYHFIMAAGGFTEYQDNMVNTDVIFGNLMPMMQTGMWISAIPLFIIGFMMLRKVNKQPPKNLEQYVPSTGRIIDIVSTGMRINRRRVHTVVVELRSSHHDITEVQRDMVFDVKEYSIFTIGSEYRLLVHPDKPEDFYFDFGSQGIY